MEKSKSFKRRVYARAKRPKYLPLLLLTAFCVTLLPSPVDARRGIKFGGGSRAIDGIKRYGADTLTVSQLKDCLKLEAKFDATAEKINAEQPGLDERKNELKEISAKISELREFLESNKDAEFTSQGQVDAYNAKARTFNQLIDEYNKKLDTYKVDEENHNVKIDTHNEVVNQFQSECAGKRYYEDDMVAAKGSLHFNTAMQKPIDEAFPQANPPQNPPAQSQP